MATEVETVRSNRAEASKPLSTTYTNDMMDALDLVEQLVRATRLVEGTVGDLISPNGFETSVVAFGDYDKISPAQTVIITASQDAKGKRFTLSSIGTGGTPDVFIDVDDITEEGIVVGDTYIIIFGVPTTLLGHAHNGVDSEEIPSTTFAIQATFGEMFN